MKTGVKVGDLMTRNFIYVSPDTDLRECAKVLIKKKVGSLIIKEGDQLKGILTEKDIIWAIVKKSVRSLKEIKAKDLMKRKVVTIKPSTDLNEAIDTFRKKKVRRLPVVEHGKVIGMLTTNDVLRIDPGLFQTMAETIKIREETDKLKRRGSERYGVCEECGDYDLLYEESNQWLCDVCYAKR
jgi:predicted transcriptional regulator